MNKRGISLVEVVIAMAVITVVTVSSISLITSSDSATKNALYKSEAQYFAADALECFRAAENEEQFESAMAFRGGFSSLIFEGDTYVYELDKSGYRAFVNISYPTDERPTFSVTVTDKGENTVAEIDFTKGE